MSWKEHAYALWMDGKEWSEIYAAIPDVKPQTIRGHIRRTPLYIEMHAESDGTCGLTTVMQLHDLHHPFNRDGVLDDIAPWENKVDILVLSEEQDCQSISKFTKLYRGGFWQETVGTRDMLKNILDKLKPKKTIIIKANHPARLGAYLSRRLDDDLLPLMPETSTELIVETGFNVYDHQNHTRQFFEPLKNHYSIEYVPEWFAKIGKSVICHPDAYRSPVMGTADLLGKYFVDMFRDIDSVFVAHTHHMGVYPVGGIVLHETGCMCKPKHYRQGDASRPWEPGYFVTFQDAEGNTLHNKTQMVMLNRS